MPTRRDSIEFVLPVEQGLPGGRQEETGWGHEAGSDIEQCVEHYNHHWYHESLKNVTPVDVFFGRDQQILSRRDQIKRKTRVRRKIENLRTGVV